MNRTIRLLLLLAAVVSLPGCLDGPPNCGSVPMILAPGECGTIPNLCRADGQWQPGDGVALISNPGDAYHFMIETLQKDEGVLERRICSDVGNKPSDRSWLAQFLYSTPGYSNAGGGGFDITTAADLRVSLVAVPEIVRPGDKVRLEASVTGGSGKYTYAWSPAVEESGAGEAVRSVHPQVTTEYRVAVTDARGKTQEATATVIVTGATCGNGIVERPDEICDDGNTDDGDTCSSNCQIEIAS